MHPNHSKHRPLFFTPRSPWGGRLESQSFRRHMRASEDKKPDPTSKEMQGLAGQMAPNLPGDSGDQSSQTGGSVWKVPHTQMQPHQQQSAPQRPATTVQQLSTQGPLASIQQQWRFANPVSQPGSAVEKHVSGSIGGDGVRRPKDEADSTQVVIQYSTNPRVKDADNRKQQEGRPSPRTPEQIDQQEDDEARDPEYFDEE